MKNIIENIEKFRILSDKITIENDKLVEYSKQLGENSSKIIENIKDLSLELSFVKISIQRHIKESNNLKSTEIPVKSDNTRRSKKLHEIEEEEEEDLNFIEQEAEEVEEPEDLDGEEIEEEEEEEIKNKIKRKNRTKKSIILDDESDEEIQVKKKIKHSDKESKKDSQKEDEKENKVIEIIEKNETKSEIKPKDIEKIIENEIKSPIIPVSKTIQNKRLTNPEIIDIAKEIKYIKEYSGKIKLDYFILHSTFEDLKEEIVSTLLEDLNFDNKKHLLIISDDPINNKLITILQEKKFTFEIYKAYWKNKESPYYDEIKKFDTTAGIVRYIKMIKERSTNNNNIFIFSKNKDCDVTFTKVLNVLNIKFDLVLNK